jgi:hypothetical protein
LKGKRAVFKFVEPCDIEVEELLDDFFAQSLKSRDDREHHGDGAPDV